jgi:cobalt/nickel transport system permease protein
MQTRPAAITGTATAQADTNVSRRLVLGFLVAAVVVGGAVSWFASTHPDGLEWAIARVSGKDEIEAPGDGVHATLARIQERTSFLPDYGFKPPPATTGERSTPPWPAVEAGTSMSGLIGGLIVLALAGLVGYACKPRHAGRPG